MLPVRTRVNKPSDCSTDESIVPGKDSGWMPTRSITTPAISAPRPVVALATKAPAAKNTPSCRSLRFQFLLVEDVGYK